MAVTYEWRGNFENAEVNALHAEAFHHSLLDDDWKRQVHEHSLGWVCARDDDGLVGFVNCGVGRRRPFLHPRHNDR